MKTRNIALGGFALASLAGYINASMLQVFHVPVSHMSGAATRLGSALGTGHLADVAAGFSILLSFFLGAALSGYLIDSRALEPSPRYGMALMLEGLLLAGVCLVHHELLGASLAAFACGLQNAMATSFRGLVLRTTHVTGILTDLGLYAGRFLHGERPPLSNIRILASLLAGFVGGGFLALCLMPLLKNALLWPSAAAAFFGGLGYFLWIRR